MFTTLRPAPASSTRRAAPLAVGLLAVVGLLLAGCSSSGDEDTSTPAVFEMRPVTALENTVTCSEPKPSNEPTKPLTVCNGANQQVTLAPASIVMSDVASVKVVNGTGKHKGEPIVTLTLTPAGREKLRQTTGSISGQKTPGNQIAILTNGKVIAAPTVTAAISNGVVQLGGTENKEAAEALALQIKAGLAKK